MYWIQIQILYEGSGAFGGAWGEGALGGVWGGREETLGGVWGERHWVGYEVREAWGLWGDTGTRWSLSWETHCDMAEHICDRTLVLLFHFASSFLECLHSWQFRSSWAPFSERTRRVSSFSLVKTSHKTASHEEYHLLFFIFSPLLLMASLALRQSYRWTHTLAWRRLFP